MHINTKHKYPYIILDILIFAISYLVIALLKQSPFIQNLQFYLSSFILLIIIWILGGLLLDKYSIHNKTIYQNINNIIKCGFLTIAIIGILISAFHFFKYSRLIIFGTIGIATIFELSIILLISLGKKMNITQFSPKKSSVFEIEIDSATKKIESFNFNSIMTEMEYTKSFRYRLGQIGINEGLISTLSSRIPLQNIASLKALTLATHNPFNIPALKGKRKQLLFNLHRINDIRRINCYLIKVNKILINGGLIIGCGETTDTNYQRIMNTMPLVMAKIYYLFEFCWKRIFPKIPIIKQVYFWITKGQNRAITIAEIIGRLYYCGFEMLDQFEYENLFYFIAKKTGVPQKESEPSYGPLIRLRRVGKDGVEFNLFKLRTMHPYAEYAQSYLYKQNNLASSGKFNNDFRLAAWGKVFRKWWVDEIPQIINLVRGDIKLFGVRALSQQYYDLYPLDLQQLRIKVKPGLIPPYYVDLPNSFEEILESERRYLNQALKNPTKTNFIYFWKAVYNIVFRGARSK